MADEEILSALMVASYLKRVSAVPMKVNLTDIGQVHSKGEISGALQRLSKDGLIAKTKLPMTVLDDDIVTVDRIGDLTDKGLDLLYDEELLKKELGIIDFKLNINIGRGASQTVETHSTVTNTQIRLVFEHISKQIENSGKSEQEKKEAKSKLAAFLKHPLITTIVGAAVGGIIKASGG